MNLIESTKQEIKVSLTQDEFYILLSLVGEMYEEVCIDSREFEVIHGVEKEDVLVLQKDMRNIYKEYKAK